jgi:hypothetical protein
MHEKLTYVLSKKRRAKSKKEQKIKGQEVKAT